MSHVYLSKHRETSPSKQKNLDFCRDHIQQASIAYFTWAGLCAADSAVQSRTR